MGLYFKQVDESKLEVRFQISTRFKASLDKTEELQYVVLNSTQINRCTQYAVDNQWWNVTKYILHRSQVLIQILGTFTLQRVEYFQFTQLYNSTQLQFRGKYCTFYSTTVTFQITVVILSVQWKPCISKFGDFEFDSFSDKL